MMQANVTYAAKKFAEAKALYRARDYKAAAGAAYIAKSYGHKAAKRLELMALEAIHGGPENLADHLAMCESAGE